MTLLRVAASFALAMSLGTAIGIVLGRLRRVDAIAHPWLVFFLNLPALVTIVLCYIWIGLTEAAAITAVALNKIPNVVVTIREGSRAIDGGENAGRTLVYRNIVIDWQTVGQWDGRTPAAFTLREDDDGPIAVIVQRTRMGPILAAAKVP